MARTMSSRRMSACGLAQVEVIAKITARAAILRRLRTRKRNRRIDSEKQQMDGPLLPEGVLPGDRPVVIKIAGELRAIDRATAAARIIPALLDADPRQPIGAPPFAMRSSTAL